MAAFLPLAAAMPAGAGAGRRMSMAVPRQSMAAAARASLYQFQPAGLAARLAGGRVQRASVAVSSRRATHVPRASVLPRTAPDEMLAPAAPASTEVNVEAAGDDAAAAAAVGESDAAAEDDDAQDEDEPVEDPAAAAAAAARSARGGFLRNKLRAAATTAAPALTAPRQLVIGRGQVLMEEAVQQVVRLKRVSRIRGDKDLRSGGAAAAGMGYAFTATVGRLRKKVSGRRLLHSAEGPEALHAGAEGAEAPSLGVASAGDLGSEVLAEA